MRIRIQPINDSDQWFESANNRRATRNSAVRHNLVPRRSQHEYRRNFFSSRVIVTWNSLPEAVRDAPTVSSFKRQYRRHLEGTVAPATCNTLMETTKTALQSQNILKGVLPGSMRIIPQVYVHVSILNLTFFASILSYICMCGSLSVFQILIRIQEAPEYRYGSNTDPDPQHWSRARRLFC